MARVSNHAHRCKPVGHSFIQWLHYFQTMCQNVCELSKLDPIYCHENLLFEQELLIRAQSVL